MNKKILLYCALPLLALSSCGPKVEGYPITVDQCHFGEEIGKVSWDKFGTVIPSITGYSGISYVMTMDEFGDDLLCVYLTYDNEEDANQAWDDYAEACVNKGYDVAVVTERSVDYEQGVYFYYDVAYADRNIGNHKGMEIQSLVSMYGGKDALGIFAYNYVDCAKTEFPSALLEHYMGSSASLVPAITGDGYTYSYQIDMLDADTFVAEIYVQNCSYEVEEEYFNKVLFKCGWNNMLRCSSYDEDDYEICNKYPDFDDEYYYQAACGENVCIIFDYDLFNSSSLVIDVYYSPNGLFN